MSEYHCWQGREGDSQKSSEGTAEGRAAGRMESRRYLAIGSLMGNQQAEFGATGGNFPFHFSPWRAAAMLLLFNAQSEEP